MNVPRTLSIIAAILSAVFSSISYPLSAKALQFFPIFYFIAIKSSLVAIFYVVSLASKAIVTRKNPIPIKAFRENFKSILLVSLCREYLGEIVIVSVLLHTKAIEIMFLTKMEPYFVLLVAWMMGRELVNRNQLLLLFLHISGAILLATGGTFTGYGDLYGDLLLIVFLLITSIMYHPIGELSKKIGSIHLNGTKNIILFILVLPPALLFEPYPEASTEGWKYIGLSFLLWNILGATLYYRSTRDLPGWLASALRALGPVFAAPVAILLFDQILSPIQIFGAIVIVATSIILTIERRKTTERKL
jgi:drug/metabolite transporter (DMT)-like permease